MSTTASLPTTEKILSVQDISSSLQRFGWADYFVFVFMLVVCAGIGVYFGFVEKRKKNEKKERDVEDRRGSEALDYLVGGRKMKVIPVSLSLVASFVSGISLLGTSTEIYVYGTQYAFILITIVIAGFISWYIFLPVFVNLQLTSTYEYFELRFGRSLRLVGSIIFFFDMITWLPITAYVPALTFNQVTGINIHIITPIVCAICIFYTCVGGLKAVVWTDTFQSFIMFGSMILIMVKGTLDAGGLETVWQRNYDGGRLVLPDLTLDPTVRLSILAVLIGGTVHKTQSTAINQIIVQRFMSLPTKEDCKKCLYIFIFLLILLTGSCVYVGLILYATYYDCDPVASGLAQHRDQMVPLLVADLLQALPGMSGLFVSAVFSASLSSMSTGLNSMSAVILEDFIKPFRSKPLSERQVHYLLRLTVVLFGIAIISLVFIVEKLGMVLQLATTLGAVTHGPMMMIFFLGICVPWVNSKSMLTGAITGFLLMTWICMKAQFAIYTKEMTFPTKNISVEGCTYDFEYKNVTPIYTEPTEKGLHHMSFMYYTLAGFLVTGLATILGSFLFGLNDTSIVDKKLIATFVHKFMKPSKYDIVEMQDNSKK
ncbi:hypothetical protein ACFFRR_000734 [Megaselia abdita]